MRGITNNYSCFSTDWYAMNTIDGSLLYVLGFDHGDSYFQHAILLDEDKYDDYTWDNPVSSRFSDFYIYIGDNADYTLNPLCPGAPFQRDLEGVTNSGFYDQMANDPYTSTPYYEWMYNSETWCNMQGRYTHIVKDFTSVFVLDPNFESSICTVGIMGTKYVRDELVTASVTTVEGVTATFDVQHIYSETPIGNILGINLRQKVGAELSFVTLSYGTAGYTTVLIDTTATTGSYNLVLESFDNNGTVKSTFVTDTVSVVIEAAPPPVVPDPVVEDETVSEYTCPVTQIDFDAFAIEYNNYFELEAQVGIGWETQSFEELHDLAFETFKLADSDRWPCA